MSHTTLTCRLKRLKHQLSGFTLLEILVALTIFSLVSLVIFSVFRAAIRTQEVGERETEMIRRARFAMDAMERDLQMIFLRDETSYNQGVSRLIEEMESARLEAEEDGDWEDFYRKYGDPDDPDSIDDAEMGNPYDKGRIIDVQMRGENKGKTDTITFATQLKLTEGQPYHPLGIARVKYFVDDDWLIRSEESIEAPRRNQNSEIVNFPSPPLYTRLTAGVKEFNISYAFWYDNQWYEEEVWNSTNRQIRNPNYILGDYRENDEDYQNNSTATPAGRLGQPPRPGEPGYDEFLNDQLNEPLDRLPSQVRIKLTIEDSEKKQRQQHFQRIFRIPSAASLETYTPSQDLTEDERENEQHLRDEKYFMIYPGVLEEN